MILEVRLPKVEMHLGIIRGITGWVITDHYELDFNPSSSIKKKIKLQFNDNRSIDDCLEVIKTVDIRPRKVEFSYAQNWLTIVFEPNRFYFSEPELIRFIKSELRKTESEVVLSEDQAKSIIDLYNLI